MNPQNFKPAAKQLTQKGEVSPSRRNSRLASKSNFSTYKPKPETPSSSKFTSGPSPPGIPSKLSRGRPRENHYLDLVMTPRDPGNQASQGVQDFIKQVSRFIEDKNPFKVTPQMESSPDPVKSENHLRNPMLDDDSRIFGFDKNKAYNRFKKNAEKPETVSERIWVSNMPADNGVRRRSSKSVQEAGKTGEPSEIKTINKKDLKAQPSVKSLGSRGGLDGWDTKESPSDTPTVRRSPIKRIGRSEIPLRKVRRDMSRSPKPVSLLLRKPFKEAESAISIDLCSRKPFTPIEELSLCSETQSNKVTASSDKLNYAGVKSSHRTSRVLLDEVSNEFKLERCLKNPNIPITSDPSCSDVLDQKSCSPKRSKVLDLDKVRTSSFTVLQNSREALCRLESLHQQNVSTKEIVFGEKSSSSKLKMLAPKSSFNSLKGKSSKKNLAARQSSKGNKPALKVKSKKSKNDVQESSRMQNQPQKANVSCYAPAAWNDEEFIFGERNTRSLYSFDTTPAKELSTPVKGNPNMEFEELEKELRVSRNSMRKAGKHFEDEKLDQDKCVVKTECPPAPPHTPELVLECSSPEERQTDEDERSSSKTVTLGGPLMDEAFSLSSEESQTQFHPNRQASSKNCEKSELLVKGTSLKFGKDEPPEKPEGSEVKKNKLQIKINFNTPEDTDCEENVGSSQSLNRLYLNSSKHSVEQPPHEGGSSEVGDEKEETKSTRIASPHLPSEESPEKEQFIPINPKSRKSSTFLRSRLQYKVSGASLKGARKKKIRSDAGDRRLPSSTKFFKSISLQNKLKLDTKLRSGLTKAYTREEKRDPFADTIPIKLKRRNSEPISFRGYIWKCADSVTPRGHKASVSSMTSSLKHLNNDDIDDFIFWEAVPQKMNSCWEMSLYHFKRPWSVLSCSVFEDNRQSSTPGLILENLRNGGGLSPRRSALNSNERTNRPKENPFDVEPSIAQKNIDIRNWLAALNFPTPPSTSIDIISEGNFSTQSSVDAQNLSKSQVGQKRRKVLANLRFSDEAVDEKADEKEAKYKKSAIWNTKEVGDLMELIQRKSGGFATNEQFLNSEHSLHRPNVTVNLCLYSKPSEEKPRETKNRNVRSEPKTLKTGDNCPDPQVEKPTPPEPAQADAATERRPAAKMPEEQFHWVKLLKGEVVSLPSDLNIWKYLFLFTLFIISIHYCFLNNNVGRG